MADDIFEREKDLWEQWRKDPTPNNASKLFNYMNPIIQAKVNTFKTAPIPKSALDLEAKKWAMKSFQTYNPNRNTRLSTHTTNWLKKLNRYVYKRQNVGYIPEERIIKIQTYKNTKSNLETKLGREPSVPELSDELAWPMKEVERMESELRKDIAPTYEMGDMGYIKSDPSKEVLNYIYFELSPQEQLVYDYTVGAHGKSKISGGDIAKKLNVSQSKVSQIKKGIGRKMERYMNG